MSPIGKFVASKEKEEVSEAAQLYMFFVTAITTFLARGLFLIQQGLEAP